MSWWSKTKSVLHGVDQVMSSPVLGPIISTIPLVNTAGGFIHAADKLFPPDSLEQRRDVAAKALQGQHPEISAEDAGKLIDAMTLLQKLGVKTVQ